MPRRSNASRAAPVAIPPFGLQGTLDLPERQAQGLILFAHGSGSSRLSPRNTQVAAALRRAGLATLLFDLLSEDEAANRANVFDIPLLAERLVAATRWALSSPAAGSLPIGYFGASTGAAAALVAAAQLGDVVGAVVSRGGRPDLAADALPRVRAPTLLIVGGDDVEVLALNRIALRALRCEGMIEVVPGATHLFEEPGALEAVTELARRWFVKHLSPPPGGGQ
jgi:putative phosphoribosyl transferase